VLLSGTDTPSRTVEDYTRALEGALARRLPMVCANPDMVAVSPGGLIATPGTVAAWYAASGGTVRMIGKPHPEILRHALALLPPAARGRLVAVGDSLAHDIAGGRSIGAATVLVEGGIHAAELALPDKPSALAALARDHGVAPDWVVPAFMW
jgi:HAD superfamily hydrolase (TIGR01459 family)